MQHNLICVKWGELYSRDYVINLYNAAKSKTTVDFSFHIFTDDLTIGELNPQWIVHPLPGWNLPQNKAWFYKMEIFNPAYGLVGRNLFLDLDVVICSDLSNFWQYQIDKFAICQDFNRALSPSYNHANSSVMSWSNSSMRSMYDDFLSNREQTTKNLRGDQDYIDKFVGESRVWFPRNWVMSYRWEVLRGGLKAPNVYKLDENKSIIPQDCKVIAFHGRPKPHEITEEILVKYWAGA